MNVFQPWQLLVVTLAGWINRQQQDVVAYIQEENRILKSKLKGKRIRFSSGGQRFLLGFDDQPFAGVLGVDFDKGLKFEQFDRTINTAKSIVDQGNAW